MMELTIIFSHKNTKLHKKGSVLSEQTLSNFMISTNENPIIGYDFQPVGHLF